ncbi:MAG: hypothetical protein KC493_07085 [Bacteriovoracaceae bacterium]|nr:hypothetical protein [Bacteriovoracaceae bacterium]
MTALFTFLKFATFGVTAEIVFTSICENIELYKKKEKLNWSLTGHSYIWMIPIYGSISFFGPLVIVPLQEYPLIVRLLIFSIIIFIVEYITGWIIRKITGKVPWHYEGRFAIHNLIRLDYLPVWMLFSGIVEYLWFNY